MTNMRLYPEATELFLASGSCNTESSKRTMAGTLRQLQQANPGLKLDEYRTSHLSDFCMHGDPAPYTVRARRSRLRAFFEWAQYRELVTVNPASSLKYTVRVQGSGTRQHNWLSEMEVAEVLRSCSDDMPGKRTKIMLMHGFMMGLRRHEIAGLRWGQYSADLSRLSVYGKGRKLVQLGVPPQLRAELTEWRRVAPAGAVAVLPKFPDWFENGGGDPLWDHPISDPSVHHHVVDVSTSVGIKFRSHDMRRSFAGILEAKGVPLGDISRLLRHASIATTSVYLESNPRKTAALADNITLEL